MLNIGFDPVFALVWIINYRLLSLIVELLERNVYQIISDTTFALNVTSFIYISTECHCNPKLVILPTVLFATNEVH